MGTENQGLATVLGFVALLFLVLLIVGYIVGKA
jgi:hypothetical protein